MKVQVLPSFLRVREDERAVKENISVLSCAKGEFESFQILLSAEKDCVLSGVTVKSAFDCSLYREHFTRVRKPSSGSIHYPVGNYPDPLLPLKDRELLQKDKNFLIYVCVKIPENIEAGRYPVTVDFVADQLYSITVLFDVYDVALPQRSTSHSCFCIRYDLIEKGEGYCDENLKKRYYDFLLSYRLNAFSLPFSKMDGDEFASVVDSYFDHPYFTDYAIPCDIYGSPRQNVEAMKPLILGIARRCRKDRNLFEKAYCYFYDEPEEGNHIEGDLAVIARYEKMLRECAAEIECSSEYESFKQIDGWRDIILSIKVLGTIYLDCSSGEIQRKTDIWVPSFASFDGQQLVRKGHKLAEDLGAEIWWYGCMGPHFPFPTYHLTDKLLSARLLGWMQKANGVSGNLYWCVNGFSAWKDDGTPMDVFNNPHLSDELPAGDGILLYPGPNPSMRLMTIRDSLEDYELLRLLETEYERLQDRYGREFNVHKCMDILYSNLFFGMMTFNDPGAFMEYRKLLLELIVLARTSGFAVMLKSRRDNVIDLEIFSDKRYALKVRGETVAGRGKDRGSYRLEVRKGRNVLPIQLGKQVLEVPVTSRYALPLPQIVLDKNSTIQNINYARYTEMPFGLAYELLLSSRATIEIPLTEEMKEGKGVSFYLHNAESRSLTMFVKVRSGNETYNEQAKEFFPARTNIVDVDLCHFPVEADSICVEIYNTYPRDKDKEMKVFLNNFHVVY